MIVLASEISIECRSLSPLPAIEQLLVDIDGELRVGVADLALDERHIEFGHKQSEQEVAQLRRHLGLPLAGTLTTSAKRTGTSKCVAERWCSIGQQMGLDLIIQDTQKGRHLDHRRQERPRKDKQLSDMNFQIRLLRKTPGPRGPLPDDYRTDRPPH